MYEKEVFDPCLGFADSLLLICGYTTAADTKHSG